MQRLLSISRLHTARVLYNSNPSHGRLKKPSFNNASIQQMEKIMHSQVDIVNNQERSQESEMMEDVLKVHASDSLRSAPDAKDGADQDWYLDTAHNIPSKWENFVPRWMRTVEKLPKKVVDEDDPVLGIGAIVEEIKRENGISTIVMNMAAKCDYTDAFIFTQGNNSRHVSAIAEAVRMLAKSKIKTDASLPKSIKMTNAKGQDWVIVDMGKYIMHVFTPEAREYYDLEGLWAFVIDPMNMDKIKNDKVASKLIDSLSAKDDDALDEESLIIRN